MKVHIQGMGLQGSLLAWNLHTYDIPFTWSDTDRRIKAWEASSGLIYPSGDALDQLNYNEWRSWYDCPPWPEKFNRVLERGAFWRLSKSLPNAGKDKDIATVGPLRFGSKPSYHLNVPSLVLATRKAFAGRRIASLNDASPGSRIVIAHGFSWRLHHYVWGWTAHVGVEYHSGLNVAKERPAFYLRTSKFKFAYVVPLAGEPDTWIMGSSHIKQGVARDIDIGDKVEKCAAYIHEASGGLVTVQHRGDAIAGWRPAAFPGTIEEQETIQTQLGRIYLPSMGGNGVRHAPHIMASALKYLGVEE